LQRGRAERVGAGRARRTGSAAADRSRAGERARALGGRQDGVAATPNSSGAGVVERRPGELGAAGAWWIWGFRVQFWRRWRLIITGLGGK
jgi:hypothetical protein